MPGDPLQTKAKVQLPVIQVSLGSIIRVVGDLAQELSKQRTIKEGQATREGSQCRLIILGIKCLVSLS